MTMTHRTGIAVSVVAVLAWSALFMLFYWGPNEYGEYPSIDFGSVRGASVARFQLEREDTVLASRRAIGDFLGDTLLVARQAGTEGVSVYVVRDKNLLYKKGFKNTGFEVVWNQALARFELSDASTGERFLLIPGEHTYILEIAP